MKINKQHIKGVIIFLLCIMFLITLSRVVDNKIIELDGIIYNSLCKSNLLTQVMKVITFMGEGITIIMGCILIILFMKDKRYTLAMVLNLIIITIITQGLKFIIKRPRPTGINLIEIDGFSFPSGHTSTAIAFYGLLIYIIYKNFKNKRLKFCLIIILTSLIALIGISRIYLGVHYASDVFASFSLATAYLIIFTMILEKRLSKSSK